MYLQHAEVQYIFAGFTDYIANNVTKKADIDVILKITLSLYVQLHFFMDKS